jgi:asparagine synthetase B (glutamine-hydrolysing)
VKGTGVIGTGINTPNLNAGILRYDRVASRWGIEPRHPFLDRRLLEYCAWMPQELRLRDGYPKWALRQAMSDRLPGEIAWRRGKEHLGYRFNHAVLAHVQALSAQEIDVLAPYMDAARLAGLPDPRQLDAEDPRAELLFNAAALARWLLARGAGGRSEDAPENH